MRTLAPSPAGETVILLMVLGPVVLAGAFAAGGGGGVSLRLGGGVALAVAAGVVLTGRSACVVAVVTSGLLGAVGEYGCGVAGVPDILPDTPAGAAAMLGRVAGPVAGDRDCPARADWAGDVGGLSAVELGRLVCGRGVCTPTKGGVVLVVAN